jgi:hypothetical protein
MQTLATVSSYEDLIAACRKRVVELGMNYAILDVVAGFAEGYSAKLFGRSEYSAAGRRRTKRHFSPISFDAYLEALGIDLVVVENPDKAGRIREILAHKMLYREAPLRTAACEPVVKVAFSRDFLKKIGRLGGQASAAQRDAIALKRQRRSLIYRANALKRWASRSQA